MVDLILQAGCDPNHADETWKHTEEDGHGIACGLMNVEIQPAFHAACENNHHDLEKVELLLKFGADPNFEFKEKGWAISKKCQHHLDCMTPQCWCLPRSFGAFQSMEMCPQ